MVLCAFVAVGSLFGESETQIVKSVFEFTKEEFDGVAGGEYPQTVIKFTKGDTIPFGVDIEGPYIELDISKAGMLNICFTSDVYLRFKEAHIPEISTDGKEWKRCSECISGIFNVGIEIDEERNLPFSFMALDYKDKSIVE